MVETRVNYTGCERKSPKFLNSWEMEKIYSNRIWISFLHFMEKRFGKETADKVLAAAG